MRKLANRTLPSGSNSVTWMGPFSSSLIHCVVVSANFYNVESFCWLQICPDSKLLDVLFIDILYPQIGCFFGKIGLLQECLFSQMDLLYGGQFWAPRAQLCCILLSGASYGSIKQGRRQHSPQIHSHTSNGRLHLWVRGLGGKGSKFLKCEIASSFWFPIKFMSYTDTVG